MVLIKLGKRFFAARLRRLVASENLLVEPHPDQTIIRVASANSAELVAELKRIGPAVVLLAGCRMLSRRTLDAIDGPVLNYHAGIAPQYRGMNGGYWALAEGDGQNFGTTVHLVDAGVDTGEILYRARGAPQTGDNIMLYALRQAAFSRTICCDALRDALAGQLRPVARPDLPSRQWYHPTIWRYLWTGVRRGIW